MKTKHFTASKATANLVAEKKSLPKNWTQTARTAGMHTTNRTTTLNWIKVSFMVLWSKRKEIGKGKCVLQRNSGVPTPNILAKKSKMGPLPYSTTGAKLDGNKWPGPLVNFICTQKMPPQKKNRWNILKLNYLLICSVIAIPSANERVILHGFLVSYSKQSFTQSHTYIHPFNLSIHLTISLSTHSSIHSLTDLPA